VETKLDKIKLPAKLNLEQKNLLNFFNDFSGFNPNLINTYFDFKRGHYYFLFHVPPTSHLTHFHLYTSDFSLQVPFPHMYFFLSFTMKRIGNANQLYINGFIRDLYFVSEHIFDQDLELLPKYKHTTPNISSFLPNIRDEHACLGYSYAQYHEEEDALSIALARVFQNFYSSVFNTDIMDLNSPSLHYLLSRFSNKVKFNSDVIKYILEAISKNVNVESYIYNKANQWTEFWKDYQKLLEALSNELGFWDKPYIGKFSSRKPHLTKPYDLDLSYIPYLKYSDMISLISKAKFDYL